MSLWTTQSIRGTLELPKQGPLSVLSSGWHWWQVHTGCLNLKWMALRGRRINDFIRLWCLVASGGLHICVSSTSFQKNDMSWPQQPLTEKVQKFNMIFHDSTQKNFFSKHKIKAEFKCLDDFEVLSSGFTGLKTSPVSMTSAASTASMASMTSTASFHQKNYWSWWFDHPYHPNDQ